MQIKVLTPKLGASALAYSPLPLAKITFAEGGIDLNHRDAGETPFDQIRMAAAFSATEAGQTVYRLMLFLLTKTRPFVVAGNHIHYNAFPLAPSDTLVPRLRGFVSYIRQHHPGLYVDRATYAFLQGKPPAVLEKEQVVLATALAEALKKIDEVDGFGP